MFHLVDPKRILVSYALVTTAISVAFYVVVQRYFLLNWDVTRIVTLSSTISSVLYFLLFSTPLSRIV